MRTKVVVTEHVCNVHYFFSFCNLLCSTMVWTLDAERSVTTRFMELDLVSISFMVN